MENKDEFTQEEISKIISILDRYHCINLEYDNYKKEISNIHEKLSETEDNLKKIKNEEDELMKLLTEKYGKLSLMEIYQRIYRHGN